ncbi:MAG: competence/damage-inducible protein A [Candidatus Eremiobacter antarcticus]|nr:competence/damage-inducible protein A [Candidatus Eremiobacteraeota bacterium]MBC5808949.1 competence/damage-inducible protein A [Candidatus Eremiobacteraeota bacterium]PZR60371.1 MAG: competence/damage-inducible protein A [Candidatus Eremiobacter sp. RRmetagenome_bin22]
MATAEIITVGTELLLGQLVDTNTAAIAAALAEAGVDVYRQTSVGDNESRIAAAVGEALSRADAVICAGGLGPTVDDMTREAVAAAAHLPLQLDEPTLADLRAFFAGVNRPMTENNARQAMFPQGADILPNPNGTAPGFALDVGAKCVISLPGPPREMTPMLHDHVMPRLKRRFGLDSVIVTRVLRTVGMPESELDSRISDLFRASINPSIAVLAHLGQVDVKLTAKARSLEEALALINDLEPQVRTRIGDFIFSGDGQTLPQALGAAMRTRGWTIASAESITGGMIGNLLTSAAGSSQYYAGGTIAYSDEAKTSTLNVAPELIERHGAVSEEVAIAMAIGARELFHTTLGISTTGIAGPGGARRDKPLGLTYIALAKPGSDVHVERFHFSGEREAVQRRAALSALMLIWRAARPNVRND